MKKIIIVVTSEAGFVGSNLIEKLIKESNYKIISIDDYSTGSKKNYIINNMVKYIKGNTVKINLILCKYRKNINCLFHFGEFSRIYQSFKKFNKCLESNLTVTKNVISFCLQNKIKLIYFATSATLENKGFDKNLSPYAFTKAKYLELLENLKQWFNFKFEII
jgi:UDP-glucose 4-epimerase